MPPKQHPGRPPVAPKPLDRAALEAIALRYVERFQTSEVRVVRHLKQKVRQRGWAEEDEPDPEGIAHRLSELGYINDSSFAEARARGAQRKGLGPARLRQHLAAYGVEKNLAAEVAETIDPVAAALAFARRRRLGPFGSPADDPRIRQRQMAAMLRAGHALDLSRKLLQAESVEAAEELATD
ncbi:MAG: RecX family transcriptional regulator [Sphingomonadaceae bacterium]